eukprot:CAMPEP_0113836778 /NCGR_PEP_ID=MMETSP0328-20130328/9652_1 /TAXON_ID=39455 /ORGANISM="Alexandrium minutum" /LENGTH=58 /DNA_ID=CAMNT_0000805197 /DNA_START=13 /DNA_END=186 /DNA_ORIENTATION=+ /assembly_acc=CAM_ASM_000350
MQVRGSNVGVSGATLVARALAARLSGAVAAGSPGAVLAGRLGLRTPRAARPYQRRRVR